MQSNIEKYKKDLKKLISQGKFLGLAIQYECFPEDNDEIAKKDLKVKKIIEELPNFRKEYQSWYSESKILIKQLLPDRLEDFVRYYEKSKNRKEINYDNYRIEDYLHGIETHYVKSSSAIPHMIQQLAILKSVSSRFESTLFDIKQLVQADIFDSELDSAKELIKHGFLRGAGAMTGVVLEKHLGQVMANHNIKIRKKHPTINDFNEALKNEGVLDTSSWRQIQRLGDIRNLCDHNKDREPTKDELNELISGAEKFTKTLF
nr:hypothetical protein [Pseudodesulfovibrio sp.]